VVHTWAGGDENGIRIKDDLSSVPGLEPHIIDIFDGDTPAGLVVPRVGLTGEPDRTILGYKPKGMLSGFASALDVYHPESAVVNSLTGPSWPDSLREGTDRLKKDGVPYTYTPGSSQFDEVGKGSSAATAVYKAIKGAAALGVDDSELRTLIQGRDQKPADTLPELLKQGLDMGPQVIFMTMGSKGAAAANRKGKMFWVGATQVSEVVDKNGAGDAFLTGASTRLRETGDIREALRWGSASASFAVEVEGAHTNPPNRRAIENRLRQRPPRALNLTA
jgi:sugar/nucleoside kinase (ribokinase family)